MNADQTFIGTVEKVVGRTGALKRIPRRHHPSESQHQHGQGQPVPPEKRQGEHQTGRQNRAARGGKRSQASQITNAAEFMISCETRIGELM